MPTPLLVPVLSSSSALEVFFWRSDGREHKDGGGCWMLVSSQAPTTSRDEIAERRAGQTGRDNWRRRSIDEV
jgi:hypothetical protein